MARNRSTAREDAETVPERWRVVCDDLRPLRARLRRLLVRGNRSSDPADLDAAPAGEDPAPRAGALVPERATLPARVERIEEAYFDTPSWTIFRSGCSLSLRATPGGARATLRPLAGAANGGSPRPAFLERMTGRGLEALCRLEGPVARRLRLLHVRPSDLAELFRVRATRESYRILRHGHAEGRIVLERTTLADDPAGAPLLAIEIEPETAAEGGPEAAAKRLAALLPATADPAAEAGPSRFDWALARRGFVPAVSPDLGPSAVVAGMNAAEAAFAVLRRHAASFLRHEAGTRLGDDPEHLHDMRVAARRLRAALRFFAEALPATESAWLREELRTAGRVLGAVRDLDVQIVQMREWAAALVSVPPDAAEPLCAHLRLRREAARRELLAYLDSRRFRRLKSSLTLCLRRGPERRRARDATPPAAALAIERAGPPWVRRARRRVRKAGDRIEPASPPADYHDLRIRCKRLRYALEFLEPLHGPPARRLIEALVAMQDLLGRHQDTQVALAFLRESVQAKPRLRPETLAAAGELAQVVNALAARLRRRFPKAYRRLGGRRWKDWKKAAEEAAAGRAPAGPSVSGRADPPFDEPVKENPRAPGLLQ